MCGACGRTTVADPVLGAARTRRQHLIVASTINTLCDGLPGVPKVNALEDGWMMLSASGATRQCRTVEELWAAVVERYDCTPQLAILLGRLKAFAADPANDGLPFRVATTGRTLASGKHGLPTRVN